MFFGCKHIKRENKKKKKKKRIKRKKKKKKKKAKSKIFQMEKNKTIMLLIPELAAC